MCFSQDICNYTEVGRAKIHALQTAIGCYNSRKEDRPLRQGRGCPFSGPGVRHGEAPRSYHLKGLRSVQEIDRIYTLILIHPLHTAILRNKDRKGVGCKCVEQR